MASRQITVTVDEEVLAKLDEFADDIDARHGRHVSRDVRRRHEKAGREEKARRFSHGVNYPQTGIEKKKPHGLAAGGAFNGTGEL